VAAFPAGAGMNRDRDRGRRYYRGVPRRRGDEPFGVWPRGLDDRRSPQARG